MAEEKESRLEQFRQMAEADPNNELGHFYLGQTYLETGMWSLAIASLQRALQINPNLGRAYRLLGEAYVKGGEKAEAIKTLTRGIEVAAGRGETLTIKDMAKMLEELGAAVPAVAIGVKQREPGEGEVLCCRCNQIGTKLARAPFRNEMGQQILNQVCAPCWGQWIEMGTKVINELRLAMNEPEAQQVFERHMLEFLNLRS